MHLVRGENVKRFFCMVPRDFGGRCLLLDLDVLFFFLRFRWCVSFFFGEVGRLESFNRDVFVLALDLDFEKIVGDPFDDLVWTHVRWLEGGFYVIAAYEYVNAAVQGGIGLSEAIFFVAGRALIWWLVRVGRTWRMNSRCLVMKS